MSFPTIWIKSKITSTLMLHPPETRHCLSLDVFFFVYCLKNLSNSHISVLIVFIPVRGAAELGTKDHLVKNDKHSSKWLRFTFQVRHIFTINASWHVSSLPTFNIRFWYERWAHCLYAWPRFNASDRVFCLWEGVHFVSAQQQKATWTWLKVTLMQTEAFCWT